MACRRTSQWLSEAESETEIGSYVIPLPPKYGPNNVNVGVKMTFSGILDGSRADGCNGDFCSLPVANRG